MEITRLTWSEYLNQDRRYVSQLGEERYAEWIHTPEAGLWVKQTVDLMESIFEQAMKHTLVEPAYIRMFHIGGFDLKFATVIALVDGTYLVYSQHDGIDEYSHHTPEEFKEFLEDMKDEFDQAALECEKLLATIDSSQVEALTEETLM